MRILITAVLTLVLGTVLGQTWEPDSSFDPGMGTNDEVYVVTLQPDGKILIGGMFTSYDGVPPLPPVFPAQPATAPACRRHGS